MRFGLPRDRVRRPRISASRALGGADSENSFAAAKLADPLAVAAEIPVAGVPQAARVGMDHSEQGQPPIVLPHCPTAKCLGGSIEPHMRLTRFAPGASRQCRQSQGAIAVAQPEQHPAGLFVAPRTIPVGGELVEQRVADLVGQSQFRQRPQRTNRRIGRPRRVAQSRRRAAQGFQQIGRRTCQRPQSRSQGNRGRPPDSARAVAERPANAPRNPPK